MSVWCADWDALDRTGPTARAAGGNAQRRKVAALAQTGQEKRALIPTTRHHVGAVTAFSDFIILRQPDDTTCGPTCLQAVYRHFGDHLPLPQLIAEVPRLETGGTLAVLLGQHALERGYRATLLTYNLKVFDPTWFALPHDGLVAKLRAHAAVENTVENAVESAVEKSPRVRKATRGYLDFVVAGGEVRMPDLTAAVIAEPLGRGIPILAGLSATYLYRSARELGTPLRFDDLHGEPQGHFVVLCGLDQQAGTVRVADPQRPNPLSSEPFYEVGIERLVCAIMLGVLTFDANLLVLEPGGLFRGSPSMGSPYA